MKGNQQTRTILWTINRQLCKFQALKKAKKHTVITFAGEYLTQQIPHKRVRRERRRKQLIDESFCYSSQMLSFSFRTPKARMETEWYAVFSPNSKVT